MKENQPNRVPSLVPGRILMVLTSLLLVAAIGLSAAAPYFKDMMDGYFTRRNIDVTEEEKQAAFQKNTALAIEIEGEGTVLLRNEDQVLPLSGEVNKVNVFGWASTAWLGGGSGSGQVIAMKCSILDALQAKGIETNTAISDA